MYKIECSGHLSCFIHIQLQHVVPTLSCLSVWFCSLWAPETNVIKRPLCLFSSLHPTPSTVQLSLLLRPYHVIVQNTSPDSEWKKTKAFFFSPLIIIIFKWPVLDCSFFQNIFYPPPFSLSGICNLSSSLGYNLTPFVSSCWGWALHGCLTHKYLI